MNVAALLQRLPFYRPLDPIMARHAARMAVASVGTLLLVESLGLEQGYWAVISAILVMQSNLGRALASGWARIIGTFVGASLGVLSLVLLGTSSLSLGVGIFLTIFICAYFMGLHESFRLAAVTAAIVILFGRTADSPLLLGLERFIEIVLGVGVAMAVSWFVLPFRARQSLRTGIRDAMDRSGVLLSVLMENCLGNTFDEDAIGERKRECIREVMQLRPSLAEASREPGGLGERGQILKQLTATMERLTEDLLGMEHAARMLADEALHLEMRQQLLALSAAVEDGLHCAARCITDRAVRPANMEPQMLALEAALHDVERGLESLRAGQVSQRHSLCEVSHFFSLVFSLREATLELMEMLGALHEKKA